MPIIPVNDVGIVGVVSDIKPHELPIAAWSDARNVRFANGYAEKFLGESAYTTPSVAPYFLLAVPTTTTFYWLYAGLAKCYSLAGGTHTDITRAVGGDYGATAQYNWTGGVLNGIPILNNYIDDPQMWATPGSGTLAALSNWPANTKCRTLRPFLNYLVAGDVTKSGTRYASLVKWSHPADPGAVPSSWNEADPTKDCGEMPLSDTAGAVIDFVSLRRANIVYKEDAIHTMQYVGGEFIFRFGLLTKSAGMLSRRCAVEFQPGYHAVLSFGDLLRHDGQQVVSIVDKRMRQWLVNNIDGANYERSFVVSYHNRGEVWFCFPGSGQSFPTLAVVWNWKDNTATIRDLANVAHMAEGIITVADDVWDSDTNVWDSDGAAWDARLYNPAERNLLSAQPLGPYLRQVDHTNQWAGSNMSAYVERTGLALPLKVDAPPDFTTRKLLRSVWPRIEGTDGGIVQVTVGAQNDVDGAVTWEAPQAYVIGTTKKIDTLCSGRLLAVRFSSTTDVDWRLHGYELDVVSDGMF